jgi:flagellar biosynthesis chaperone FliJ
MKKFVWRLQRVLEIKQSQLLLKKAELLKLTEMLALKRTELMNQQVILQQMIERVAQNKTGDKLPQQRLLLISSRVNDKKIKIIKKEIEELQKRQKEKTAEYLKLKRFTEGMEKLKEKAKQEYISAQEKLEQKEMDERAAMSFARSIITANH